MKSKSSCWISEIEGFVFGPFNSRFWVMRKHMNLKTIPDMAKVPFLAWNCLSLQIKKRGDVYLIIKNERVMDYFIKFLIYSLETIDGNRGTATQIIKKRLRSQLKALNHVTKR